MKKISKILLSSVLSIALSLSLIVGGTFALFTSQSGTNVAITSGTVKVTATATLNKLESAKADPSGTLVDENGEKYSYEEVTGTFTNGGTAELSGNVLTLTNVTPGDKATISLAATNESNVNVKYRYTVNVIGDLAEYLTITLNDNEYEGLQTYESAWTSVAPAATIDGATLAVALPMDAAAEAMGKTADVAFTVNAVQGNAVVSGQETVVCATKTVSSVAPVAGEETVVGADVESDTAKVGDTKVVVPADTAIDPAKPVTLSIEESDYEIPNFTLKLNETATPVEIKLDNVTPGTPVEVSVFVGKDLASVKIYHVDTEVTPVTYDPDTGIATFTVDSFSPFTLVVARKPDYTVTTEEELNAAITAAKDGEIISLGTDITLADDASVVVDGKKLAFDLNGHKLAGNHNKTYSSANNTGAVLLIKNNANLTITDNSESDTRGTIENLCASTSARYAIYSLDSDIVLDGGVTIAVNTTGSNTGDKTIALYARGKYNIVVKNANFKTVGTAIRDNNTKVGEEYEGYITIENATSTGKYLVYGRTGAVDDIHNYYHIKNATVAKMSSYDLYALNGSNVVINDDGSAVVSEEVPEQYNAYVTLSRYNNAKVYVNGNLANLFNKVGLSSKSFFGETVYITDNTVYTEDAESSIGVKDTGISSQNVITFDIAEGKTLSGAVTTAIVKFEYAGKGTSTLTMNAMDENYEVVDNACDLKLSAAAVVLEDGTRYLNFATALKSGNPVKLNKDVELTAKLNLFATTASLDLNGHKLTMAESAYKETANFAVIYVGSYGTLTIKDTVGTGCIDGETKFYGIDITSGGVVNVESGTIKGATTAVQIEKGTLNISGGEFSALPSSSVAEDQYRYTINCIDANYKAGTAKVSISGGKFYKFNPADNASEGAHTNYVAEGYVATEDGDYYVVTKA